MAFTNLGCEDIIQGRVNREEEEEPEPGFRKHVILEEIP